MDNKISIKGGTAFIKGFSITLSLGIICSMFTAIFVTKMI